MKNSKPEIGGGKFKKVFEEGPIGMALVRLSDFGFDFVNKRLCDMLNYSEDEMLQFSFPDITHKDDVETDLELAGQLINGEIPFYQMEKRYLKKGGDILWIKLTAAILRDEGYGLAMIEDIHKHKLLEEKLRVSEARYRALARNFPNGAVVLFDHNLKYLLADGKGLGEIGLSKSTLEGKTVYEIFPPDTSDILEPYYRDALAGIENVFEVEFANKVYEVRAVPIKNSSGEVIAGMTMSQDITENKRHIKDLQELNKNKDKFFSIISHDLRSPFSNLLGLTQFLADDIEDLTKEEIKEFSTGVYASAKSVFELLENLLEWSRIQTGRITFDPQYFNLKTSLESIIKLFSANAENKKIAIRYEGENEILINADKNMISTVFRNLISNAIKFSNAGQEIIIKGERLDGFYNIHVIDKGIGIRKENIKKIFKIEEQITTKGTYGERGTGLGLMLTKEFVNKNNGSLNVSSELGKGSDFTVTLPSV